MLGKRAMENASPTISMMCGLDRLPARGETYKVKDTSGYTRGGGKVANWANVGFFSVAFDSRLDMLLVTLLCGLIVQGANQAAGIAKLLPRGIMFFLSVVSLQ